MWKKIKKSVWRVLNFLGIGAYIQLFLRSYLKDIGWIRSYHSKQSVDAQGQPIPWFTYSFIHFLEKRLKKNFDVFEYGCGNSTIWFAQRVNSRPLKSHFDFFCKEKVSCQGIKSVKNSLKKEPKKYLVSVHHPFEVKSRCCQHNIDLITKHSLIEIPL